MFSLTIIYGIFHNIDIRLLQTYESIWHNFTVLLVNYDFFFIPGYYWFEASIISPIGYQVTDMKNVVKLIKLGKC